LRKIISGAREYVGPLKVKLVKVVRYLRFTLEEKRTKDGYLSEKASHFFVNPATFELQVTVACSFSL
jgi:hypothetical protein